MTVVRKENKAVLENQKTKMIVTVNMKYYLKSVIQPKHGYSNLRMLLGRNKPSLKSKNEISDLVEIWYP